MPHSLHRRHSLWNVFPTAFVCSAKYTGLEQRAQRGVPVPGIARLRLRLLQLLVVLPVESGLSGRPVSATP